MSYSFYHYKKNYKQDFEGDFKPKTFKYLHHSEHAIQYNVTFLTQKTITNYF